MIKKIIRVYFVSQFNIPNVLQVKLNLDSIMNHHKIFYLRLGLQYVRVKLIGSFQLEGKVN